MDLEMMTVTESPCGWERDLAWKMSQAAPADTVRGVFFNGALSAVRELGDEEAVRHCLEASGEQKFLDFFSYPLESFLRLLACAARRLGRQLGCMEAALRELGRHANADFLASPVGRAALLLASGSPRRLMETAPHIYQQSLSFGVREVVWTGPSCGRVRLWGDLLPSACNEGALEALLHAAGGRGVRVEREWTEGLDAEYAFSWE
jgi:uncharacterized protein (TIGR02265 family)